MRLFHRQSIISFTDYQKILNIYQFFPKNKYVEELLDTDDSDVTGEEDKDATDYEVDEDSEYIFGKI